MHKNTVYFMGGAKGVGKTALIREVSLRTLIPHINTGDFFAQPGSKEEITDNIVKCLSLNAPLIADTHYAGFIGGIFSGNFERGLNTEQLGRLLERTNVEFLLITLPLEQLLLRRMNDKDSVRDSDAVNIYEELKHNELYFREYCEQAKKQGTVIENICLSDSLCKLLEIIK